MSYLGNRPNNGVVILSSDDVTGSLPIVKGGTGSASAPDALTALLPSQSTANLKVLQSNGTSAAWATPLSMLFQRKLHKRVNI